MKLQTLIEILSAEAQEPFDYPTQVIASELIITARQTLIRQQYEKTKTFPTNALIDFCFPLVDKSSTECCGLDLGCTFPVSATTIPLPMDVKDSLIFNYVGSVNGMEAFGYLKPDEIKFVKYRKFSSHLKYYTWINRKLIFINAAGLQGAKVRYVPANPLELADVKNCDDKPCFDIEDETFIEGHWEDTITKMVLPKLLRVLNKQINVDEPDNKQG